MYMYIHLYMCNGGKKSTNTNKHKTLLSFITLYLHNSPTNPVAY